MAFLVLGGYGGGRGGKPDADHLKAGTNMEAVRDFSDVIAYLQKAGAKELTVVRSPIAGEQLKTRQRGDRQLKSQHVQSPGRWWGIRNRKRWKELRKPPERLTLTDEQVRAMELELADQWRALAERKGWELDHLPKRVRGKMIVPILRAVSNGNTYTCNPNKSTDEQGKEDQRVQCVSRAVESRDA